MSSLYGHVKAGQQGGIGLATLKYWNKEIVAVLSEAVICQPLN